MATHRGSIRRQTLTLYARCYPPLPLPHPAHSGIRGTCWQLYQRSLLGISITYFREEQRQTVQLPFLLSPTTHSESVRPETVRFRLERRTWIGILDGRIKRGTGSREGHNIKHHPNHLPLHVMLVAPYSRISQRRSARVIMVNCHLCYAIPTTHSESVRPESERQD